MTSGTTVSVPGGFVSAEASCEEQNFTEICKSVEISVKELK